MKRNCIILLFIISFVATFEHISFAESFYQKDEPIKKRTKQKTQTGSFYTGVYQNLFVEQLGKSEDDVKDKVCSAFNQLFHGDDSSQRVYYQVEPGMAYIEDVLHKDVRSEGMSYGMMIAVQLDKKEEFDRLWKWAKTYMQHKNGRREGYFVWQCKSNGEILDSNSASDGEEWIVTSLFFASARWGDGDGIYNYKNEAQKILDAMLNKVESSDDRNVKTNMFNKKEKMVVFVPSGEADDFTDPSYHIPHFYEIWAKNTDRNKDFWYDAAVASREYLKKAVHPKTGLAPDYSKFDGTPYSPWSGGNENFQYDAWRVAMNVAVDYQWFAKDEWAVEQSNRILNFFYSEGIKNYVGVYSLDGSKKFTGDHNTGLVAMNAVAALASTNDNRQEFVQELWDLQTPSGMYRYYDGMLYMLGLLQVSGNFQIYESRTDCKSYVSPTKGEGKFVLSENGKSAPIVVSSKDYAGVIRVANQLQKDIESVTTAKPEIVTDEIPTANEIIIIGTIGKSPIIDKLIEEKKLNVENIAGRWETFVIQTVKSPLPNVTRALVIAGSDKRGTIFGIYDLAEAIGVSPWYWWADVPAKKKSAVYIKPGRYSEGEPKVKYRGIFINDEAPALSGWIAEKFGGFNSKFYEHVFELILRLKGNFLWPAMWGRAFYDDDPINPKLADEYGVVISTSHHEPMMRAHDEWRRYGKGPWDYEQNDSTLKEFWRQGIERMGDYESIVTLAMRGDGDAAMSPDANLSLLQNIVTDQRKILAEVTKKDVTTIPQVWALYKEVQEYYDKGMRVPDDVTLLLCDDNWGNIRKLPALNDKPRKGGYGIYYHFDFVGGPRNYKWLNTTQIEKVWEQMHLSYEYGAKQIWVVNVGDIKPMEFPISFFLDYTWDPEKISANDLPGYYKQWAAKQFGDEHAEDIADIIKKYTRYNSRRKPEMLAPDTYSLVNYREAETVVDDYNKLYKKALKIGDELPEEYQDAYYQLILHPVEACANLNELYVTVGKNQLYAKQGRAATNDLASEAKKLFERDADISSYYNKVMAGGKWNHMMDQKHIGYTSWQEPDSSTMPNVRMINIPEPADMGVAIEGSENFWSASDTIKSKAEPILPEFDQFNKQSFYIDIFNRGKKPFAYSIKPGADWILVKQTNDPVVKEKRIWISIDWDKIPVGTHKVPITINGTGGTVVVSAVAKNFDINKIKIENAFAVSNNYISIEAVDYSNAVNSKEVSWEKIPGLGRTYSAITTMPVTASSVMPGSESPRLEFKIYLFNAGEVNVKTYLSPVQNFGYSEGLRYAISIDDETPQIININKDETVQDWKYPGWWNQMVSDNIKIVTSNHVINKPGEHILKYWFVDPGIVLEKIVLETGEVKPSYLGPPQSFGGANLVP
ncbi:MAG: glycosyl hydrolase family 8 [bacterium]